MTTARIIVIIAILCGFVSMLSGCANHSIKSVQGLGFSNQNSLIVATPAGARIYSDGAWSDWKELHESNISALNSVQGGIYLLTTRGSSLDGSNSRPEMTYGASDHGLPGQWRPLIPEVKFRLLGASFDTHMLYVWNDKNQSMKTGLSYSKDEGVHWQVADANGFNGMPAALAVHPANDAIVALGNSEGLWLSRDYGEHFYKVYTDIDVTSLFFGQAGNLYVAGRARTPFLFVYDYNLNSKKELPLPPQLNDTILFITENLENRRDMAIATNHSELFFSHNKGEDWFKL